jgi:hypothetical protein
MKRRFLGNALAFLGVLLLVAGTASAQVDVVTGRISGEVNDESGQPLPGASVEAKNKGTGLALVQISDSRGLYHILNLPLGNYDVTASLAGFQKELRTNIVVSIGGAATVDFRLKLMSIAREMTVTAERPLIETTNTASQTNVDNVAIQNLPSNGRNFTDFVLLTPNTQKETQRGNLALGGQRGLNTNVTVDGVDFNDAFFGGSDGTGSAEGRAPFAISQESVREFQVIQNGASVEFGRSGGGFVNVVTKSGSNEFHGSGFYYNRPSSLTANFANGASVADQKTQQFGASIGGFLMKDHLFFFGSWDQQKQTTNIPITNGLILDPDIAAKYPKVAQTSPTYGQTQDGRALFGRFDYQMNDQQRITARGNFTTYTGQNGTSSAQTQAESHNGVEGLTSNSYVGNWNGNFTSNVINDLNFQYSTNDIPRADKGLGLPEIQFQNSAFSFGEVAFLPIVATDTRYTVGDTFSYLMGAHALKAGAEYNNTAMNQIFKGNWRGVFVFSYGNDADRKAALLAGKWTQYREFIGLNGLTADQAGLFNEAQNELAFFVQDQWYVTPGLTVTAGLRYERLNNPNDPILDVNKVLVAGAKNVVPDTTIPDANNQWSPRLSIAWTPEKNGKSVIRLSLGRYWARTPEILFAQLYTANGIRGTQYTVNAGTTGPQAGVAAPGWGPTFKYDSIQQLGNLPAGTALPAPGVFGISPDFKNSHVDRVTLGGERDIFGVAVGIEGAFAKSYNLERVGDANLAPAPIANCPALDPASGVTCYGLSPSSSGQNRINSNYGRVTEYLSDAHGDYKALTLSFRKNLANGVRFFGSWSRQIDRDTDSNERNYSGIVMEDVNNPDQALGPADRDIPWRILTNASYEKSFNGFNIFSGMSFVYSAGRPYTVTTGADNNKDGNFVDRPTINGVHFGRNSARQPDFYTLDARIGAGHDVGPGKLSVFLEIFNLTNTGNRSTSNGVYGSAQTPTATFATNNLFTNTPRTLQLSGRFDF